MFFELDSFRKTIPCFGSSTFGLAVSRFFSKMSDCNFGDALGKFLKTGARPDSEARTLGNATVTWNGNSFALTSRKGCVGNIYFSCAAVQDSSNCLGQLGGCLFARMFFLVLWRVCCFIWTFAAVYLYHFTLGPLEPHIQIEDMILILFYSHLLSSIHLSEWPWDCRCPFWSCQAAMHVVQGPSLFNVKCSWPKVPLGWSTKIQCAAKNILAVGCTSPGHIRSCQDFNPGIS